jgi:hypothetical protein
LQQLKQEIRAHGGESGGEDRAPGRGGEMAAWPAALERVHASARVNPHLPIAWPTWPRGLWPKVVAFSQKVVRRLLRWYVVPIVEQQNRFNVAVAQTLDLMWREIARLQAEIPPGGRARKAGDVGGEAEDR